MCFSYYTIPSILCHLVYFTTFLPVLLLQVHPIPCDRSCQFYTIQSNPNFLELYNSTKNHTRKPILFKMATTDKRKPDFKGLEIFIREDHYAVPAFSMSEEDDYLLVSSECGLGRDYVDDEPEPEFDVGPPNRITDSQQWGAGSTNFTSQSTDFTTKYEPSEKGVPKQSVQCLNLPKRFSPIIFIQETKDLKEDMFDLLSKFD